MDDSSASGEGTAVELEFVANASETSSGIDSRGKSDSCDGT